MTNKAMANRKVSSLFTTFLIAAFSAVSCWPLALDAILMVKT
jgi:hypothetical protein